MFDDYCPDEKARVLIFPGQIIGVDNVDAGIDVHYRCWCGRHGVWHTGRARTRRAREQAGDRAQVA